MKAKIRVDDIANVLSLVAMVRGGVHTIANVAQINENTARTLTNIVVDLDAVISDMTDWIEECGR